MKYLFISRTKIVRKLFAANNILPILIFLYVSSPAWSVLRYALNLFEADNLTLRLLGAILLRIHLILFAFLLPAVGVWVISFFRGKYKSIFRSQGILILGLSLLGVIYTTLLIEVNSRQYDNFLYYASGINLSQINFIQVTSWALFVVFLVVFLLASKRRKIWQYFIKIYRLNRIKPWTAKVLLVFISFLLMAVPSLETPLKVDGMYLWAISGFKVKFGEEFQYFSILKELPEDAFVILPPQDRYPTLGNMPVVQYFLFPRPLVSSKYLVDDNAVGEIKQAYFFTLEDSSRAPEWPIIDPIRKDIIFDGSRGLGYLSLRQYLTKSGMKIFHIVFK